MIRPRFNARGYIMLCKVIATPVDVGDGMFKGWNFTPDNGRQLNAGEVRFTYNPRMRDHYKRLLAQAQRDYLQDIEQHYTTHKASKQALEYTQKMRAWVQERDKFLREGRELKHESL